MAARVAVAIRQDVALARLTAAANSLAQRYGVPVGNLSPSNRDPNIERAEQLEALAGFLEALHAASTVDAPPAPAPRPTRQK